MAEAIALNHSPFIHFSSMGFALIAGVAVCALTSLFAKKAFQQLLENKFIERHPLCLRTANFILLFLTSSTIIQLSCTTNPLELVALTVTSIAIKNKFNLFDN